MQSNHRNEQDGCPYYDRKCVVLLTLTELLGFQFQEKLHNLSPATFPLARKHSVVFHIHTGTGKKMPPVCDKIVD